jgi:hypothetical protein
VSHPASQSMDDITRSREQAAWASLSSSLTRKSANVPAAAAPLPWLSFLWASLPSEVGRVCEVNVQFVAPRGGAAARNALLSRVPSAQFYGLAFSADNRSQREGMRAALAAEPAIAGLHNRSGAFLFFGDKMRTVRAAPALDRCDAMIVHDNRKVMADMPNILQRVAVGSTGSNVLVLHGPACLRPRGAAPWCDSWVELVSRRLVIPLGCVPGGDDEGWCVGRVVTSSACSQRHPLLPQLPVSPKRSHARGVSGSGLGSPTSGMPTSGAPLQLLAPTSVYPWRRPLYEYESDGWQSVEVAGLRLGYWWRYFTVIPHCEEGARSPDTMATGGASPGAGRVCLFFKNHVFESWVGGVSSVDGGRSFEGEASLVIPTTWPVARMTHNLAIERDDDDGGSFILVGGQFKLRGSARCGRRSGNVVPCRPGLPGYNGLWMVRGRSWRFVDPGKGTSQISTRLGGEELARRSDEAILAGSSTWSADRARWIFNGTHPGCIERRSRFFASMAHLGSCEFDGRLSLVRFRGELRLFARANPATHGQRFVQTTSSADGGRTWGPFAMVSIDGYEHSTGDIYFFAVSRNPVHSGSLVALFPLAHRFRGCIGIAVSTDGLRWSAPTPLLRCAVHGERATHHPAQGFVREGGAVSLYVHENVPGVTSDITPTAATMRDFPYLKLPRPRLVRHTMPSEVLLNWTHATLAGLGMKHPSGKPSHPEPITTAQFDPAPAPARAPLSHPGGRHGRVRGANAGLVRLRGHDRHGANG